MKNELCVKCGMHHGTRPKTPMVRDAFKPQSQLAMIIYSAAAESKQLDEITKKRLHDLISTSFLPGMHQALRRYIFFEADCGLITDGTDRPCDSNTLKPLRESRAIAFVRFASDYNRRHPEMPWYLR